MVQIQGQTQPEGSVGVGVSEGRAGTSWLSLVRFSTAMVSGEPFLRSDSARKESGDEALLRRRLRAVCVLFLAARLAFGAHSYLTPGTPLAAGSWLLLAWLGIVWLILRPVGGLSLRGLRITEFLIFPLVAVDLGTSLDLGAGGALVADLSAECRGTAAWPTESYTDRAGRRHLVQ